MTADWSQDLFDRPVGELPVLGHPLAWWQERGRRLAAEEHGMTLRMGAGVYADPAFVTEFCRRTVAAELQAARARVAIGALNDEFGLNTWGAALANEAIEYDLTVHCMTGADEPGGGVLVSTGDVVDSTPQPGRSTEPLRSPVRPRVVWGIGHWSDVLVANLLAVGATTGRVGTSEIASGAIVHPTAVVERSAIREGAIVGPYTVVQDSIVGTEVTLEDHTSVKRSWVADDTVVQTGALVHRSYVGSGSVIGFNTALRGSVVLGCSSISAPVLARSLVGEDVFLARGVTVSASNLSDRPVSVRVGGCSRSSGMRLLGCAIGSGARVGSGIHLPAGYEVPAGRFLAERPMNRVDLSAPRYRPLVEVGRGFRPIGFAARSEP
jgi:carbonic anhydrase/acetyltransferase-like protein (isoleucine patch superfamily)